MNFRNGALVCLGSFFAFNATAQTIGGCPAFPSNNIWNARVDTLPVHARSAAWVNTIGPTKTLHQDWGGEYGMPINLVTGAQPKVPIQINEGVDESDPGPYPFPPNARVEVGSDQHVIVVDTSNCVLYETFYSFKNADNSWTVYSAAKFDLRKNLLRPQTWTSADAAGLPIAAGLPRYDEFLQGEIKHALRFTAPLTTREYLWPARHFASYVNDPSRPSMGARFRLKANFDISSFSQTTQVILTALKRYGMMLSDNGGSWYIQGEADPRWADLADEWRRIPGSAFEAVDTSSLMESIDSAAVKGSPAAAATLTSAAVSPATVNAGTGSTFTVNLTGSAGAGGALVTLSSSNGAVAPVQASVLVPEGSSSANVALSTNSVATQTQVTLTATLAGIQRQAALTVNPPPPTLDSAAFLAPAVTGGQPATLRVNLSAAAPAGGLTVTFAGGTAGVASIVGNVLIPSGSTSANAAVTTNAVQAQTQVLFTASMAGVQRQVTLTVNPSSAPALVSAGLGAASVTGGTNTVLTVTLSAAAPAGGISVALSSLNPGAAAVPPSVNVPAGSTSAQAPVTTSPVNAQSAVELTATLAGQVRKASLTVLPPAVSALSVNPNSVPGGTGASCTLILTGKAPSGGFSASLTSSNTAAATVSPSMTVPAGQTGANCAIATKPVTQAATVQIQASALGRSVSANLSVTSTAPAAALSGILAVRNPSSGALRVTVTLTAPAGQNGAVVILNGNNPSAANLVNRQLRVPQGGTSATGEYATNQTSSDAALTVTATFGGIAKSATVTIPKLIVALAGIDAPAQVRVGSWVLARVTLTGRAASNPPAPAVTVSGVVNQTTWVNPLTSGRSSCVVAFRAASAGTGSISISYGGVTKSVTVTAR